MHRKIQHDSKKLIGAMQNLGYPADQRGVCHGVAMMSVLGFLSEGRAGLEKQNNRIYDIMQLSTYQQKNSPDIRAYFDGIEIIQQPHLHREWFNHDQVYQQSTIKSASLVTPHQLESKGGMTLISKWPGIYTYTELTNIFTALEDTLKQTPNLDVALCLSSYKHTISLCYDSKTQSWNITDLAVNLMITGTIVSHLSRCSMAQLALRVIYSLEGVSFKEAPDKHCAFETIVYTDKEHEETTRQMIYTFKKTDSFIQAHHIDEKRALYRTGDYSGGAGLISIAAFHGHVDVIKKLLTVKGDINMPTKDAEEKALDTAALYGHYEVIELLLTDVSANINARNTIGLTPIQTAATEGHLEIVTLLHAQGAILGCEDNNGFTTLMHAVTSGNIKLVEFLLEKGENPNAVDKAGVNIIHIAAGIGHFNLVDTFIKSGINPCAITLDGSTSMHYAVQSGNLNIMKLLKNSGVSLDSKNNHGNTPLHIASENSLMGVLNYLLDNCANINTANNNGSTPLLIAASEGHADAVECLLYRNANLKLKDKNGYIPLNHAIYRGYSSIVNLLIDNEHDLDINIVSHEGETLLHDAVLSGNINLVKLVLLKGARVNVTYKTNKTPLFEAVSNHHLDITKLLLDNGAHINIADERGYTPLHEAFGKCYPEMANILLDYGSDCDSAINSRTKRGVTPLYNLLSSFDIENLNLIESTLKKGARLDIANEEGKTPLHLFHIYIGASIDFVKLLISAGGRELLNNVDNDGRTPLHAAVMAKELDVIKYFIQQGAKVTIKDKKGNTPLDIAKEQKHPRLIEFLQSEMDSVSSATHQTHRLFRSPPKSASHIQSLQKSIVKNNKV